jgi:V8-like Glu-specific endopeptidase
MTDFTSAPAPIRKLGVSAIALLSILASSTTSQADQVARKLIGNPVPPSPSSLSSSIPVQLPGLSIAKLKQHGLLDADGTFVRPIPVPTKRKGNQVRVSSIPNSGGPVLEPVQVIPVTPHPRKNAMALQTRSQLSTTAGSPAPLAYGSYIDQVDLDEMPFTTSRIETGNKAVNSKAYPFRTTGKLLVTYPDGSGLDCSATLVKKGVIITAAHCIATYGSGFKNANWTFIPGLYNGKASYGRAQGIAAYAPDSYIAGSGSCLDGVVCSNDVAVIVLSAQRGKYIGSRTGWLGLGYDGFGYSSYGQVQITQLGYPIGIDYGNQITRNDSLGVRFGLEFANNTLIGSPFNEGSSGGPWVSNFGTTAGSTGAFMGYSVDQNMIVGVTSWGYLGTTAAVSATSPFTSENIGMLMNSACSEFPAACAP